jgi:hypothetical protein
MSVSKKLWALLLIIASSLAAFLLNHPDPEESLVASSRMKPATLESEKTTLSVQVISLTQERKQLETQIEALQEKVTRLTPPNSERTTSESPAPQKKSPSVSSQTVEPQSPTDAETPFSKAVLALVTRAGELNRQFTGMPDKEIPELQYLDEGDWLHLAKAANLDSPEGVRKALADVRQQAKVRFAPMLTTALSAFYKANNAQPPISMEQLKPYFNVPVDDATLARYQIVTDPAGRQRLGSSTTIQETAAVDPEYDSHFEIGLTGWSATTLRDSYSEKIR